MRARGHLRLAKIWAEQENRPMILKHSQAALQVNSPDVTVQTFLEDDLMKAWNNDPELQEIYKEFQQ